MFEKSTVEPIFCIRQVLERYREKYKKLCMVFINVENDVLHSAERSFKMGVNKKRGLNNVY